MLHAISEGRDRGGDLDYTEVTSDVNITATVEASANALITGGDIEVNGSEILIVEISAMRIITPSPANGFAILNLHTSTNRGTSYSDIGQIAVFSTPAANSLHAPLYVSRRLTPAAGVVRYRLAGWVSATTGTPKMSAGAGGAGTAMPASMRVTRA